jgi:hypothetical protein
MPRQPDDPYPVPVPSSSIASGAATLRAQLRAAVEADRDAAEALTAADPATAAEALSALRSEHLPSRVAPVLRLVTQAAGGEVERVLGRGLPGAALPERDAARLSPHIGSAVAGAARLPTDDAADVIAAAHHARAHVAQGQRGELTRAAAKGLDSGGQLGPSEAEAIWRPGSR